MNTSALFETNPVQYNIAAINIQHYSFPPQSRCFRPHWHDRIELIRLKRGEMQLELSGNLFTLSEGELAIVPPKQLHKGYTHGHYADYDVMMFDIRSFYNETELCQNFLPAIFDGRAQFKSITSNEDILICFDSIMQSAASFDTIAKIYNLIGFFFENELLHLN